MGKIGISLFTLHPEILSGVGLAELPVRWSYVPGGGSSAVTGRDPERERLTSEYSI